MFGSTPLKETFISDQNPKLRGVQSISPQANSFQFWPLDQISQQVAPRDRQPTPRRDRQVARNPAAREGAGAPPARCPGGSSSPAGRWSTWPRCPTWRRHGGSCRLSRRTRVVVRSALTPVRPQAHARLSAWTATATPASSPARQPPSARPSDSTASATRTRHPKRRANARTTRSREVMGVREHPT